MQPFYIAGYSQGLTNNKKPFLLPDQAFSNLKNAYVWRERVKKREGLKILGRLSRTLVASSLGNSVAVTWSFNIYSTIIPAITGEPDAEIFFVNIVVGAVAFIDNQDGTLTGTLAGNTGIINYATGDVTLFHNQGVAASLISVIYFPSLPVMGIWQREIVNVNEEQTIFFDTKYAYIFNDSTKLFEEWIPGTTWSGSDSDFFWSSNYRGSTPESRLFFVTNFLNNAANPIRYTDGITWTSFSPAVTSTTFMFQARIIIPYYGRLLALNVWEGAAVGTAVNIFNRCRFSQIGNPIAADAWRSDIFGKGGFLDAPTNESIVSATFYKNTLIVFFERSTWQLRYVGEYGLPFIWERVSSDFGSESTFSSVLFDSGVLSIGDRAIIASSAVNVDRIDLDIPDLVFNIHNDNEGPQRVNGVRDFQRELVFWSVPNFQEEDQNEKFPNNVIVFNYRNNTYAIFRDNVTFFGTYQSPSGVTWDSTTTFWDDESVTWDDPDSQSEFPFIVAGNQEGFVHYYGYKTPDDASLSVKDIDLTVTPLTLTIIDHNLETDEIIYLSNMLFLDTMNLPVATDLNDQIYRVVFVDKDTVSLRKWDTVGQQYYENFSFTPATNSTYIGGGKVALFPKLEVQTKDFNPYQDKGGQSKLCYIDFLTDATPSSAMSVVLYANSSPSVEGNLLVGNKEVPNYLTLPYYVPASDYAWHRFYATMAAQYFRVLMTYDDDLMNDIETHRQTWILNAMTVWVRPGGKIVF